MGYRNLPVPVPGFTASIYRPRYFNEETVSGSDKSQRYAALVSPIQREQTATHLFLQIGRARTTRVPLTEQRLRKISMPLAFRGRPQENTNRASPRLPMTKDDFVSRHHSWRNDTNKLLGGARTGRFEEIIDVLCFDSVEDDCFALVRLNIPVAVSDDDTTPLGGGLRIRTWFWGCTRTWIAVPSASVKRLRY